MSLGEQSFFWQYPEVPLTEEESEYYQVNGQEMSSVFESMFTTGISPEFVVRSADDTPKNYIGSSLAVSAGEGLSVIVSPGSAMIKGHPYLASLPINIGVAEGITDILLQMNTTTDKPFISLVSRPRSGGNIEDNVKREALIYELAIGTVEVPIGAIAVTPVMIKDHRLNMTLSPINKQPIAGLMQPKPNVGTLGIWEDWNKLDDYIKKSWADFIKQSTEAWATYISGKNAEWEQIKTNVNGEFDSLTSQFNTQITTNQSNFERWFSTLQTMLDGDVAAELAGKVAKLQADKANKSDVYTKSEIDTKLTETNKSITAIKSTTYTKSETDLNRTYTLTHSKSGAVHTLAGLPTTNGIYQCQFRATADYAEGETFVDGYTAKPNGEETKLPDKAFVSGDIVSVTVDVGGKKLGFKLGGGGGYGTLSPQIKSFNAKAGNHEITLNWNNPSDSNFAGLYLVRKQGSAPQKLTDGKKIDVGKATSYTDNEPENGKLYYYRAFTYNQKKQVQTELTGAVVNATPKAGIPLKDLPVGTLVKSNIGSSSQNMIVIQKSKPSSMYSETCNGIWLLTQNIIELKQWNDTNYNVYSTSTINSYLNGDFLNSLDSELKKYISTVKIPFIDGVGGAQIKTGENGLLCKVFLLCGYEAGISTSDHSDLPIDGSKCSYFDSGDGSSAILKRNALYNGVGTDWYYRTAGTYGDNYVWGAGYNNKARNLSCDANNVGIRPTFIVNNECLVNPVQNSDGSYTIV